jgi:hypothetical protein
LEIVELKTASKPMAQRILKGENIIQPGHLSLPNY